MSIENPQAFLPPELPPSAREHPQPSALEQAARASWLAPLVAVVLLLLTWKMPQGTGSIVIAIICGALVLAGLGLGIAALAKIGMGPKFHPQTGEPHPLRGAIVQSAIGVAFSLLVVVWMLVRMFFTEPPRAVASNAGPTTAASTVAAGPDAIVDYPGWVGDAVEQRTFYRLIALPEDAPSTREFKSSFGKDFTVLLLVIDASRASYDAWTDTSRAVAHFTDGRTVDALPIQMVLDSATRDREKLVAQWMPPQREQAGSSRPYYLFIPMPAGTMFQVMDRVTIHMGGLPLDIRGKYLSAQEKNALFRNQQQAPTGGAPSR